MNSSLAGGFVFSINSAFGQEFFLCNSHNFFKVFWIRRRETFQSVGIHLAMVRVNKNNL